MSTSDTIERFLGTGTFDPRFPEWSGGVVARRAKGNAALREVLVRVIGWRCARAPRRSCRAPEGLERTIAERIRPMVAGMFGAAGAARLLQRLPGHVRVLTPDGFEAAVGAVSLADAWALANMLLDEIGAPALSDDAPTLHGLCSGGVAYVVPGVLEPTTYSDVVVHEVAHLLHLLPDERSLSGRPAPLLVVPPRRRETFAYACELLSLGRGDGWRDACARVTDARVDEAALYALVGRAYADPDRSWATIRDWAVGGARPAAARTASAARLAAAVASS
jgi:hypothetical protein